MAERKRKRRTQKLAIQGANEVRRTTFNGLPIVDAKADFSLLIHTRNVKAAEGYEKDAANCILAKACAEQVGASIVAFFRRTAYLELPDSTGARRVVRYLLDEDAAAIVRAFDTGKSIRGEITVTLKAPPQAQTLDAVRERSRRAKARRKAVIKGELAGDTYPAEQHRRFSKPPRVANMDVRSGIGMVHNTIVRAHGKTA